MNATRIAILALGLGMLALAVAPAGADVKINEVKAKGTEFIELHNTGPSAVDLTGWTLADNEGTVTSEPLSGTIAPLGFLSIATTLGLSNDGPAIELKDPSNVVVDRVGLGIRGGAPLGFNSTGRFPDGDDTDDDARDFEYLDDSVNPTGETPGAPNVHGVPALGSSLKMNELDPFGTGQPDLLDRVEIYNPTGAAVNIQNWVISDADGWCRITAPLIVPAGGFLVLSEGVVGEGMDCTGVDAIEFGASDVAYLYNAQNVRVDQLGINGAPTVNGGETLQRCPNGAGPSDGYNYLSAGGGSTYVIAPQSEGQPNNCPVAVEPTTWGQLKAVYR
jgi:hypothetical protein